MRERQRNQDLTDEIDKLCNLKRFKNKNFRKKIKKKFFFD